MGDQNRKKNHRVSENVCPGPRITGSVRQRQAATLSPNKGEQGWGRPPGLETSKAPPGAAGQGCAGLRKPRQKLQPSRCRSPAGGPVRLGSCSGWTRRTPRVAVGLGSRTALLGFSSASENEGSLTPIPGLAGRKEGATGTVRQDGDGGRSPPDAPARPPPPHPACRHTAAWRMLHTMFPRPEPSESDPHQRAARTHILPGNVIITPQGQQSGRPRIFTTVCSLDMFGAT